MVSTLLEQGVKVFYGIFDVSPPTIPGTLIPANYNLLPFMRPPLLPGQTAILFDAEAGTLMPTFIPKENS